MMCGQDTPAGTAQPDWRERTGMLLGPGGLERLQNSCVAVIGAGGVGGYAAEMIARAGAGRMIIMDSDVVSVTNKNRQILALDSTVGHSKCGSSTRNGLSCPPTSVPLVDARS